MFQLRPSARDVFEILVREHTDMLAAFLRSLVMRDDVVDDLFQETMMVAWRRLADYDRTRPFGPWLRGIAARLVMAQRRRAAIDASRCTPTVLDALEQRFAALDKRPGDSFLDRAGRLRDCVDKLPDLLRETVELAYGRGLVLSEIASSVQASEEAVKKRIQRARGLLAACIDQREATT
jgi:RNA polymerase sigma factor (sigma-70 family)